MLAQTSQSTRDTLCTLGLGGSRVLFGATPDESLRSFDFGNARTPPMSVPRARVCARAFVQRVHLWACIYIRVSACACTRTRACEAGLRAGARGDLTSACVLRAGRLLCGMHDGRIELCSMDAVGGPGVTSVANLNGAAVARVVCTQRPPHAPAVPRPHQDCARLFYIRDWARPC